jgi:hypothetical protein
VTVRINCLPEITLHHLWCVKGGRPSLSLKTAAQDKRPPMGAG